MQHYQVAQTGAGSSKAIQLSQFVNSKVGIQCVVGGAATYTVESTFDDLQNPAVTPTWFPHPNLTAQSTNKQDNYDAPPAWVRVTVSAGAGSVTMTLIQGGSPGL